MITPTLRAPHLPRRRHHRTDRVVRRGRRSVGLAAAASLLVLAACGDDEPAHQLVGYRPSGAQVVDEVPLEDASNGGAPFDFRAEPGELLVAYFGYTFCPDVCPTSLSMFKNALAQLGDDAQKVDLAMATIDPARDTAEVISGYVQSFVPTAHGVRTDDAEVLRDVTDAFGVTFMVTTGESGDVEVAHSGAMYVVDDQGELVLTWPFGVTADDVAADLEVLLDEADAKADA
ncbi:MAG: SCO family protein [Acidimicrobiales bacterium]|nr:SCO family protein [Acidimicrobiales bacterium]MCB9395942.1 SCO family protein [Acidimicrobiaceae bacterium]